MPMTIRRALLDRIGEKPVLPFASAEEAWFWFMRCEKARAERALPKGIDEMHQRPCDPDDIFRAAKRLHGRGVLFPLHLEVMGEYGFLDRLPDPANDDEIVDWVIWIDAFDALEPILINKGIVA